MSRLRRKPTKTDAALHDADAASPSRSTPVRANLSRSRELAKLWMLRMLVKLDGQAQFLGASGYGCDDLARRLGLPVLEFLPEPDQVAAIRAALGHALVAMEGRDCRLKLPVALQQNLVLLEQTFRLSAVDSSVLALAILLTSDDDLCTAAGFVKSRSGVMRAIATVLRLGTQQVTRALSARGALARSGLLTLSNTNDLANALRMERSSIAGIAFRRYASATELAAALLARAPAASLLPSDFAHVKPAFTHLEALLRDASDRRRRGVNVLLHGAPGVGKTELVRTLARQLDLALYEVACEGDSGEPQSPETRLANTAIAQHLLKRQRALLVLDEIDAMFNDGSHFFGKPSTAELRKAWVNRLLETGPVPTFWIANQLWGIDPAFVRRFDLVIEMTSPGRARRAALLAGASRGALDAADIARLSEVDSITPAIMARSVKVLRRMKVPRARSSAVLEQLIDETLKAQGKPPIRRVVSGPSPAGYDPGLSNCDADLDGIAQGLARTGRGRICLHGPPGTGKTAFGRWLADRLDRPWMLKRMSALQSPFLGLMERNLARAFDQALDENAVLQIDEVDSFLRDRSHAKAGWEVSQVNEFLTQLESFEGIFIASTNLMTAIDGAALRRFDYKIHLGYLREEQRVRMLRRSLQRFGLAAETVSDLHWAQLSRLANLTAGDFAVVDRKHQVLPFCSVADVILALKAEAGSKAPSQLQRIGFV